MKTNSPPWRAVHAVSALCFLLGFSGCFAFSSFQSARPTSTGGGSAVFGLSRSNYRWHDQDDPGWLSFRMERRIPVNEGRGEVGLFGLLMRSDDAAVGLMPGIEIKKAVMEDHLAIMMGLTGLQASTGLLATVSVGSQMDLCLGTKAHVGSFREDNPILTYHVGTPIRSGKRNWVVYPELTLIHSVQLGEIAGEFGVAIQIRERDRRKAQ